MGLLGPLPPAMSSLRKAQPRTCASAASRLAQSLIETHGVPLRVRWSRPARTPPGPSSMKRSQFS